jgi:hypothetical protein
MSDTDRLRAIQQEVNEVLEERMTDLLGRIKAVRDVTLQIASTDVEIQRQEHNAEMLDADLAQARSTAQKLEILQRAELLREGAGRARVQREQLIEQLATVAAALRARA